jgi:Mrp family chromosome partitioning ATPase
VNLAFEAAGLGGETLLVDADTYGGTVVTPASGNSLGSYEVSGGLKDSDWRSHVIRNVVILEAFECVASHITTP